MPRPSPFRFDFTAAAASFNASLLDKFDNDLGKVIEAHPGTVSSYGSELRPIAQLEPLLRHYRHWSEFKQYHEEGVDYPFTEEISEADRLAMLQENISRGNHRSAMSKEARVHVAKAMESDIELGYGIPISIPGIYKLKDAEVYPLGLQTQQTIDEAGRSIPKKRLTHDLSHNREKGCSVNQRVDISSMPRATYGHALSRFLHLIHHLRWSFPNERILCNKIDIEKAYRRLHASAKAAAKCIAIWHPDEAKRPEDGIGVLLSRLPFGSSPAPPGFCTISEAVFDLANDLLNCPLWDPEELPSPQADLLHDPEPPGDNTPFGVAMEADVKLDPNCKGGTDGFIDDGACAVLASPSNSRMVARGAQATLMSLFLVFRPLAAALEPMKRPDAPSLRKLEAEGMLREVITFLGWKIDTRAFTISLPEDK